MEGYFGQSADKQAHGANARGIPKSKAMQESSIAPLREETGDDVSQPATRIDFNHCTGREPQTSNPCGRDFQNVKCLISRIPRTEHFKNCGSILKTTTCRHAPHPKVQQMVAISFHTAAPEPCLTLL